VYSGDMKNKSKLESIGVVEARKPVQVLRVTAKCSDMFSAQLIENGKVRGDYDGYVPSWMPGEHYGDYVELEIDLATGQILNWRKPLRDDLIATFGKRD